MHVKLVNFCRNIRMLRLYLGLDREQMARLLQLSVGHIDAMERGCLPPDVDVRVLEILWERFRLSAEQMFSPDALGQMGKNISMQQ